MRVKVLSEIFNLPIFQRFSRKFCQLTTWHHWGGKIVNYLPWSWNFHNKITLKIFQYFYSPPAHSQFSLTSPVCSRASQRLGIFEDERLESVDILETFLGPTSDQETPADGENQNVFILCPFLFTRATFSQVSRKNIFLHNWHFVPLGRGNKFSPISQECWRAI